jgi:hypothetical protein
MKAYRKTALLTKVAALGIGMLVLGNVTTWAAATTTTKWMCTARQYGAGADVGNVSITWGHTPGDAAWACNHWISGCQGYSGGCTASQYSPTVLTSPSRRQSISLTKDKPDGTFTPTASIIQTFGHGERRFRITWRGDADLKRQCGSLLNSFRNRAPNSQVGGFFQGDQSENWQCWIVGDENGYKKYSADITLWVIKPNRMKQGPGILSKPICELGHDNRQDIVRSLKEHFNRNVTIDHLPTDVLNECDPAGWLR